MGKAIPFGNDEQQKQGKNESKGDPQLSGVDVELERKIQFCCTRQHWSGTRVTETTRGLVRDQEL
jgi:hypothetical protein